MSKSLDLPVIKNYGWTDYHYLGEMLDSPEAVFELIRREHKGNNPFVVYFANPYSYELCSLIVHMKPSISNTWTSWEDCWMVSPSEKDCVYTDDAAVEAVKNWMRVCLKP
jgi:hypothetical protein